jgi:hypothetical protein
VLAVMVQPGRTRAKAMAERLPAEVFRDPYRRAVFEVLAAMRTAGRAVDVLTVDWELARAGLPLYEAEAGADGVAGETFAARLARAQVTDERAVEAISGLQAEQVTGGGREGMPDVASSWAHGQRRGRGGLREVPPRDPGMTWPVRMVQRPPGRGADGPDRGPRQAR